ncbi:MAG: hypothetical protein IKO41_16630 [Lachnospiraceae bacterium]|nr:hypothetical protein [Lachnospiraceae bacterium]
MTEEFFPATGKGGFNSGSRLAYSMLDVDNEEVEKHIIYLIDDSDRGDERPIGTMQYDFKNIKCGICEFLACDFEQLSLESMQNIVAKMALGNHTTFANAKDEESVDAFISKLRKDLVYVDDESDSDDDGLPDLYEECIREYRGKEIRLDKEDEDSDDDYLSDGEEVKGLRHELSKDGKQIRVKVSFNSNPKSEDTDEDGLGDFDEVYIWETNPRKPDTDDYGLDDRHDRFDSGSW